MKQRLRQGKLNLSNRRKTPPEPEYGDWRKALSNPAEAEHLEPKPVKLSLKELVAMRTEVYQSVTTSQWMAEAQANSGWEEIHGLRRVLRLVVAYFVMLPLSISLLFALLVQLHQCSPSLGNLLTAGFWLSAPVWFSLMGSIIFVVCIMTGVMTQLLVLLYVLGHELTHAIAALMCGGRVHSLRVTKEGGYVETDADNVFIALAPYFVPIWMLCWLGGVWLVNWCCPFASFEAWFYGGFGFWCTFHVYWTIWILPREQPDMLSNGIVFSTLMIFIMNMLVCVGVLRCFGLLSLTSFGVTLYQCALAIGFTVFYLLCRCAEMLLSCM